MEHVTFDEFFDFVKNEDADWYIPGLKEYFEGLNQDEIYIQDNFLGKLVFQFNKFENNFCLSRDIDIEIARQHNLRF